MIRRRSLGLHSLRRHSLRLLPIDPGWSEPFAGKVVRSALGNSIHQLGAGTEAFASPETASFALDASELDGELCSTQARTLRLTTFQPEVEAPLLAGLRFALPQGLGPERVRFAIVEERSEEVDLDALAWQWLETQSFELRTPTFLKSPAWREAPAPGMILGALGGKLKQHGLDLNLPSANPEVECEAGPRRWERWDHRSQATGQDYPVEGWVGSWRIRLDPAQARWFAVGEALGVGKGCTRGQGVMRPVG